MSELRSVIDSLHDKILVGVDFDWKTATVRVRLRAITIVVEGVTSLECPRTNAWGPSDSILEADLDDARLVIRMQSGDDIVVVGTRVKAEVE